MAGETSERAAATLGGQDAMDAAVLRTLNQGSSKGPEDARRTGLERRPWPVRQSNSEVIVEIELAGLCRTDLYVAEGRLEGKPGVVLGHEAVGHVTETGSAVTTLQNGDRVAFDPWIHCGNCDGCRHSEPVRCHSLGRLGIDVDGVFAQAVRVPAANAIRVSKSISAQRAAYLEPVAAAMGVLRADLHSEQRILIAAENRIAELTARLMMRAGLPRPTVSPDAQAACSFDVVIDAGLSSGRLASMLDAVRPGGLVIIKSRSVDPVELTASSLVEKDLTLVAPPYGSFAEAARALEDSTLGLDDLFGQTYPLDRFEEAFREATSSEAKKVFITPA